MHLHEGLFVAIYTDDENELGEQDNLLLADGTVDICQRHQVGGEMLNGVVVWIKRGSIMNLM